jgi:transcriptional regulator with PAS, ATPase and Fis domain
MTNFTFQNAEKCGKRLISELEKKIERYAKVPHYVLITGMRGTGKTTIAKRLHEQGARVKKEFVNLNCASLTAELLESELFGYEKGAFTGANSPKMGLFEIANGGTLFLDEIGEIPLVLQAKLLKAVEEKRIRRVGSNLERAVDTRIIAATSQNLEQMIAEGRFRADLFDRLNILRLETVPLKFQKEKIVKILTESLEKERQIIGRNNSFEISAEAVDLLLNYDWHGNFRELHNFATRIAVECFEQDIISADTVC